MCGIAGYIDLTHRSVSPVVLKNMTDSIAHRGPDGEGQWIEGNVGIGHRRLSIIDLTPDGHQPMISADQRYVLSYNGEIYNFKEIRAELQSMGFRFNSKTDSEVALYALVHWQEKAVLKFNGMFALALWDRQERKLLLARDRFGIKPLYYSITEEAFSFASEQKAIRVLPNFKQKIDKEALLEYFTFQNIFTDKTLEKSIKILPAGHTATITLRKHHCDFTIKQYWDFNFSDSDTGISNSEYQEELDQLMQQAINRQLVSDVELGAYLSGGIDSGSVVALASKHLPNLKTFTCGFDLSSASGLELSFDERQKAEYMSYCFKTEHYQMVLKSGDMERCMNKLVTHLEEPRVGQSYPNLYAAKLASKFVKVTLSGTGGDELFGGYPWRYYRAVGNSNFDEYVASYYLFWQRLLSNSDLKRVFSPVWDDVKHVWTADIFKNVFQTKAHNLTKPEDFINHSLYFECKTFLHGLLVVEDKLSMANSLETRVPFLDNDLVDFAMRCPIHLKLSKLSQVVRLNENDPGNKLNDYYKKTKDGKQILRQTMKRHLPGDIFQDKKKGFSAPDASWFKGDSIEFVKDLLLNKNAQYLEYFDFESITQLINEHLTGKENRRLLIWSLLYFEIYLNNLGNSR